MNHLILLPLVAMLSPDSLLIARLPALLPDIEAEVVRKMQELNLPGLSVGIVTTDGLVWSGAWGVRDVESGTPVEAETVFRIASMTKSFTAAAILKLRDEGLLSLDDPAARYVPELGGLTYPSLDSPPITIRHLLSHSAGFPEDNPWGDRFLDMSEDEFSARMRARIPFSTPPGTTYEYSNTGFAILGRIVTRVAGFPYQQYIRDELLLPLGMTSTFWDVEEIPPALRATGHRIAGEGFEAETPLRDGAFGAMGGLWTTREDLATWVAFMLSAWPPRDDPEDGPVRRSSRREMQQMARSIGVTLTQAEEEASRASASASGYGFGLRVEHTDRFALLIGHGGGLPGYGSHMRWLPDLGIGVIGLSNRTYAPIWQLTRDILLHLADAGALGDPGMSGVYGAPGVPTAPAASTVSGTPRTLGSPSAETPPLVTHPALRTMRNDLARLILDWEDDLAVRLAAENLFLDRSLAERRDEILALREGMGACQAGDLVPENALRGSFPLQCQDGRLDVRFTLSPTNPPKVQFLEVRRAE